MACLGAAETGSNVAVSEPAKKALATVRSDADEVAGDANAAMAVSSKAAARALVPAMLVSANWRQNGCHDDFDQRCSERSP